MSFVASGTIEDYTPSRLETFVSALAQRASLPRAGASVRVRAASVVIEVRFPVTSEAAGASATAQLVSVAGTAEAADSLLAAAGFEGATVTAAPSILVVSENAEQLAAGLPRPPPPALAPSPPVAMPPPPDVGFGGVIGGSAGLGAALIAIFCCVSVYRVRSKRKYHQAQSANARARLQQGAKRMQMATKIKGLTAALAADTAANAKAAEDEAEAVEEGMGVCGGVHAKAKVAASSAELSASARAPEETPRGSGIPLSEAQAFARKQRKRDDDERVRGKDSPSSGSTSSQGDTDSNSQLALPPAHPCGRPSCVALDQPSLAEPSATRRDDAGVADGGADTPTRSEEHSPTDGNSPQDSPKSDDAHASRKAHLWRCGAMRPSATWAALHSAASSSGHASSSWRSGTELSMSGDAVAAAGAEFAPADADAERCSMNAGKSYPRKLAQRTRAMAVAGKSSYNVDARRCSAARSSFSASLPGRSARIDRSASESPRGDARRELTRAAASRPVRVVERSGGRMVVTPRSVPSLRAEEEKPIREVEKEAEAASGSVSSALHQSSAPRPSSRLAPWRTSATRRSASRPSAAQPADTTKAQLRPCCDTDARLSSVDTDTGAARLSKASTAVAADEGAAEAAAAAAVAEAEAAAAESEAEAAAAVAAAEAEVVAAAVEAEAAAAAAEAEAEALSAVALAEAEAAAQQTAAATALGASRRGPPPGASASPVRNADATDQGEVDVPAQSPWMQELAAKRARKKAAAAKSPEPLRTSKRLSVTHFRASRPSRGSAAAARSTPALLEEQYGGQRVPERHRPSSVRKEEKDEEDDDMYV